MSNRVKYLLACYVRQKGGDCVDGLEQGLQPFSIGYTCVNAGDAVNVDDYFADYIQPGILNPEQESKAKAAGQYLSHLSEKFVYKRMKSTDVLCFKEPCLFVKPQKGTIFIPVVRTQMIDTIEIVKWKTSNKTAVCGVHYANSSGEIVFTEGETEKCIEIDILDFSDDGNDLRFQVELSTANNTCTIDPMTVHIQDHKNFYDDEKQVVQNLRQSKMLSIDHVKSIIQTAMTPRTFHAGLQYLCSTASSLPVELTVAFEFTRTCLFGPKISPQRMANIVADFFRFLPENFYEELI